MRCANIPQDCATFLFGFYVLHSGTLHCHCYKYVYLTVCLFPRNLKLKITLPSPHPLPDNQGYLHIWIRAIKCFMNDD